MQPKLRRLWFWGLGANVTLPPVHTPSQTMALRRLHGRGRWVNSELPRPELLDRHPHIFLLPLLQPHHLPGFLCCPPTLHPTCPPSSSTALCKLHLISASGHQLPSPPLCARCCPPPDSPLPQRPYNQGHSSNSVKPALGKENPPHAVSETQTSGVLFLSPQTLLGNSHRETRIYSWIEMGEGVPYADSSVSN